ncbi:hypothetical protein TNCV_4729791 [Trichonephila clavipes]|nr:hypothetical protein TNCV_4729791 [Trichonephila clavipes]
MSTDYEILNCGQEPCTTPEPVSNSSDFPATPKGGFCVTTDLTCMSSLHKVILVVIGFERVARQRQAVVLDYVQVKEGF